MSDTIPLDTPQGNNAPKTTFIYCLKCPTTGQVRYIGKANDPVWRLKQHISKAKHDETHKSHWLLSLRKQGLRPVLEILEECPFDIWQERETFHIEQSLQLGHPLTNTYRGSRGPGVMPQETRDKLSAAQMGKKKSPETLARMRAAQKGHLVTPEAIAKRTASRKGWSPSPETRERLRIARAKQERRPHTEETKRKVSESKRGKKMNPEAHARAIATRKANGWVVPPDAIAKTAAAQRGVKRGKQSPEQVQRRAEKLRGKKRTPEQIERLAAVHRGRTRSAETRAKLVLAWERRRARSKLPPKQLPLWDDNQAV